MVKYFLIPGILDQGIWTWRSSASRLVHEKLPWWGHTVMLDVISLYVDLVARDPGQPHLPHFPGQCIRVCRSVWCYRVEDSRLIRKSSEVWIGCLLRRDDDAGEGVRGQGPDSCGPCI